MHNKSAINIHRISLQTAHVSLIIIKSSKSLGFHTAHQTGGRKKTPHQQWVILQMLHVHIPQLKHLRYALQTAHVLLIIIESSKSFSFHTAHQTGGRKKLLINNESFCKCYITFTDVHCKQPNHREFKIYWLWHVTRNQRKEET